MVMEWSLVSSWRYAGAATLAFLLEATNSHAQNATGYKSVSEARQALTSTPGVVSSQQGGWLIVEDRATRSLWSFAPSDHPGYPTVVKRSVVQRDGRAFVDMDVLCEAPKSACDRLVADFTALNEQMMRGLNSGR
jgi:hypothetical protein